MKKTRISPTCPPSPQLDRMSMRHVVAAGMCVSIGTTLSGLGVTDFCSSAVAASSKAEVVSDRK